MKKMLNGEDINQYRFEIEAEIVEGETTKSLK